MEQSPQYVIEMLHITKEFPGIKANDDITLQLRKGEIHALLGENGAGKSTLMSVLFGLYQPEEGEIRKNGKPVKINDPNDATALGIGMVHQHFKLVDHADAQCVCIIGVADDNLLAVFADLTSFRLVQAKQHAHQCTFAGAVLAQQGMYLAFAQLQGDIVVWLDSRELRGNVEHFDHKILCQSAHSPFVSFRHRYFFKFHYT